MIQRREALPASLRLEFSRTIVAAVRASTQFREARSVMGYWSFGSEIDTMPLLEAILESGKTLVLPRVNRASDSLEAFEVKNMSTDLSRGVWGIREPNPEACVPWEQRSLDLIVVPGVAFDLRCYRIGYGKGYYDKLLSNYRDSYKMGAAFEVQIVDQVPEQAHDVPVDAVITEARTWSKP